MAGELDIGTLSGRIELDDRLTPVLDLSAISVEQFDKLFGRLGNTVTKNAAGFVLAEVAISAVKKGLDLLTGTAKDFTMEGARMADVEENFNRLADNAGRLSSTLLNELKAGTHGTITDFELMKTVNQDLAAGMNLTDEQFRALADGAFALAQATGTDVASALDTMNSAMLTGRTRAISMLTGKIDLAAAEQKYAESLGVTVDHLSAEGKLEAARAGILESVAKSTERLGEQTDGLDEMIDQVITSIRNWYAELSKAIATSPHVIAAFEAIRDALIEAFGGDAQDGLKTVVGWVNKIADAVATYGPVVIKAFGKFKDWLVDIYNVVQSSWEALPNWLKAVAGEAVLTAGALGGIVLVGGGVSDWLTGFIGTAGNSITALSGFPTALANIGKFAKLAGTAVADFAYTLGPLAIAIAAVWTAWEIGKSEDVSNFFETLALSLGSMTFAEAQAAVESKRLNDRLIEQAKATFDAAGGLDAVKRAADEKAEADKKAAIEAGNRMKIDDTARLIIQQTTEEQKKMQDALDELNSSGVTWQETLKGINSEIVKEIQGYMQAGVSAQALATVYNLTATQLTAIGKATSAQQDALKIEQRQVADATSLWEQYLMVRRRSGEVTESNISDLQRIAASAQEAYESARMHSDQWSSEAIDAFYKTAVAARNTAEDWEASLGGALGQVSEDVRTLSGEMADLEARANVMRMGGTETLDPITQFEIDRTPGGARALLAELEAIINSPEANPASVHDYDSQRAHFRTLARIAVLKDAYNMLIAQVRNSGNSFQFGGVGDFGSGTLAVLHGRERITPLDNNGGGDNIGPGFHITNYINGTAADVARKVSEQLMRTLKQVRQFGAS